MAFTCPACRLVSHHPADEQERYCGQCHQFFNDAGQPLFPLAGADVVDGMRSALQTGRMREALCRGAQPCPACGDRQVQLVAFAHDDGQLGLVDWKCRMCKHEWSWRI